MKRWNSLWGAALFVVFVNSSALQRLGIEAVRWSNTKMLQLRDADLARKLYEGMYKGLLVVVPKK